MQKILFTAVMMAALLTACSSDDDNNNPVVHGLFLLIYIEQGTTRIHGVFRKILSCYKAVGLNLFVGRNNLDT